MHSLREKAVGRTLQAAGAAERGGAGRSHNSSACPVLGRGPGLLQHCPCTIAFWGLSCIPGLYPPEASRSYDHPNHFWTWQMPLGGEITPVESPVLDTRKAKVKNTALSVKEVMSFPGTAL